MRLKAQRVHVARAKLEEAALVRKIMLTAFAEYREILHPPSSSYKESLEEVRQAMSEGGTVLARLSGRPVGSARFKPDSDHLYVGRVAVIPEYRGRGIAAHMMKWMEEFAPSINRNVIRVDVRMVLENNLSFFKRMGYELVTTYQHPRGDAICGTLLKRLDSWCCYL